MPFFKKVVILFHYVTTVKVTSNYIFILNGGHTPGRSKMYLITLERAAKTIINYIIWEKQNENKIIRIKNLNSWVTEMAKRKVLKLCVD